MKNLLHYLYRRGRRARILTPIVKMRLLSEFLGRVGDDKLKAKIIWRMLDLSLAAAQENPAETHGLLMALPRGFFKNCHPDGFFAQFELTKKTSAVYMYMKRLVDAGLPIPDADYMFTPRLCFRPPAGSMALSQAALERIENLRKNRGYQLAAEITQSERQKLSGSMERVLENRAELRQQKKTGQCAQKAGTQKLHTLTA